MTTRKSSTSRTRAAGAPRAKKPGAAPKKAAPKKAAPKKPVVAAARAEPITDVSRAVEIVDARRAVALRASVRRPDDLFVAELALYNLRVVAGTPPTLARLDAARDAILVVELPPQSFGEEAFLDATGPADGNPTTPAQPLPPLAGTRIRMAGPSRLAFTMPDGVTSIPYTLEALLDACRTWPARRALSATPEPSLPLGRVEIGDVDVLGAITASSDFAAARRTFLATVRDLGTPDAEAAAIAAGRRVADQAVAGLGARDPVAAAPLAVQLLRSEVETLATRFAGLRDRSARAVTTVAVAYQAATELGSRGLTTKPGLEAAPVIPLLSVLIAPYRPGRDVTALELPYRLLTSPIAPARWIHRAAAVARQGRHELWHTRLTTRLGTTGADAPGALRAIWSDDYPAVATDAGPEPRPFRMPLDAQDRRMLVQLMAGAGETTAAGQAYRPRAARAHRLILSALGGLLDAEGAWPTHPDDVDLEAWRHLTSSGRDHYVRVVYAGYLLPFGHAASLIKVTERKFEGSDPASPRTKRVAALRQRFFIVVREPVKAFDGAYHATGGHPFPFTSIELLTRVTPNLVAPDDAACRVSESGGPIYARAGVTGGSTPRQVFWPMLVATPGGDFRFDVAAIDRDGRRTTFSLPLLFMSSVANTSTITKGTTTSAAVDNVATGYNAEGGARREATMGGASICYAPPDPSGDGDPRLPTDSMLFRAGPVASKSTTRVNVYPEAEQARVALRAVQRILGRDDAKVAVRYPSIYRTQGFGAGNPGEVFLELTGNAPWRLEFGPSPDASRSDAVGAVAAPSMGIRGMSRRIGPAADLGQVTSNTFDPTTFFADARILGSIQLADVVAKVTGLSGGDVPKLLTRELPATGAAPARVQARYEWRTTLHVSGAAADLLLPRADGANPSPFEMLAVTTAAVGAPGSASATASARLGNFKVNLFGFIVLWFRELRFTAERGRKPDIAVDLHRSRGVEFGGPLEFVNALKEIIPGSGFSDPPALTVTPSGIAASYALTVPSVQVGVFALSGLTLGASFSLPFDNRPVEVGFNFAERENPFSLTVSLLGGGGFFAIGVGADGVREIEAALEAGARLAIDLGVASGSVEIKAGIYFHWLAPSADADGLVELAGYVRLHGELDVLGLISASLTFNLQLAYTKTGSRSVVWGEATLTIEIDVLLFSGEVTVRCRREFGGSEADPTFVELVPGVDTWSSYCLAFAEG